MVMAVGRRGAPVGGGVGRLSLARLVRSEEHRRQRSTMAGEAKEMVASDELAPGPEVHDASSSGVLRGEGKVGVWFPGSDDDRVVGKRVVTVSSSGSKRAEDKCATCMRRWRLHARRVEQRWRAGRQRRRKVAGGPNVPPRCWCARAGAHGTGHKVVG
jgi:hypothetical protein